MSASTDLISVVERAYDLDSDIETWLDGVLDAAHPLLDRGLGVAAYQFDASGEAPRLPIIAMRGCAFEEDAAARLVEAAPPPMVERTYLSPQVCATASEATGLGEDLANFPPWRELAQPMGMVDSFGVRIAGPRRGSGIMLHGPVDHIVRTTKQERQTWGRVAAHIAAGYRLRDALESRAREGRREGVERGDSEAVLQPDGQLVHAEDEAKAATRREALRQAVAQLEEARGPLRRTDAYSALGLWQGLVAGRWTLVDSYEEGGRRYLVARRNEPEHRDPRALTPRERQVVHLVAQGQSNKLVAYTLGLSLSTVATHIARAKSKLGAASRAELIRRVLSTGIT